MNERLKQLLQFLSAGIISVGATYLLTQRSFQKAMEGMKLLDRELMRAARRGDAAKVQTLLSEGADINAQDKHKMTSLMQATKQGKAAVVQILLDKGAQTTIKSDKDKDAQGLADHGVFKSIWDIVWLGGKVLRAVINYQKYTTTAKIIKEATMKPK